MKQEPTRSSAIRPLLGRVGLGDKEIEVYLAILSLKVARASDIAKSAKQSRSHTYLILRGLMEKGLVSEVERGKVIQFVAEPPERLLGYVEDRERDLEQLKPLVAGALPFLADMSAPLLGRPRVTLSYGIDGMKQTYRDALSREFHAIFNPASMYKVFGENIITRLFGKDAELRGKDLLVRSSEARRYIRECKPSGGYAIRLLPEGVSLATDTLVYDDTIALFAYDDERTTVRIENKNLADTFRAWHAVLWHASKNA